MTKFVIESEEQREHDIFLAGPELVSFIYSWEQEILRAKTKYGDGKSVTWGGVSDAWYKLKEEHDIKKEVFE